MCGFVNGGWGQSWCEALAAFCPMLPPAEHLVLPRVSALPVLPRFRVSTPQGPTCAFEARLCSLPGEIDELAYISTNACRLDGQGKSTVCTVSSDSTVRAWDVQEVSPRRGQGATRWVLVRSFPFTSTFSNPPGHPGGGGMPVGQTRTLSCRRPGHTWNSGWIANGA